MLLLAIIVLITLGLLITQAVRIEIIALGVIAVLGLTGLLLPSEALSGFSNSATLTVAAMLVLSAGLERTGVVDYIGASIARHAQGNATRLSFLIAMPTILFSAFMNNTAIIALMIPVVLTLSRRTDTSASKLLLPISYFSILAGTCTLIGTSTNILVDSLYRQHSGPGFGMFEFSALGLSFLIFGGVYIILVLPKILPERTALSQLLNESPGQFVSELTVPSGSKMIGRSINEAFEKNKDIHVLELIRNEEVKLSPAPDTLVQANDVFLIEGSAKIIHEMLNQGKFVQGTAVSDTERITINRIDLRMVEAVVTANSRFLQRQVQRLGLSKRQGINVLAIRRLGRHHQYNLRQFRLKAGDILLLQGEPEALQILQEEGDVLIIEGIERTLTFPHKAPIAIGILLTVVLLAAMKVAPIVLLAFAGVALMILTGCLTMGHATRALDSSVLFLLASTIPLGLAMEKTGLAGLISEFVVAVAGSLGPVFLIGCFYLLTNILTEFLSNNAAAVLLTPICLGVATTTGIDPKPLLIAVAFGASASFSTPIGYQTNTMVMGPGGYLFRDYLRVGIPLNIIMFVVAIFLIPIFWTP